VGRFRNRSEHFTNLIDIEIQAEIELRQAGYETRLSTGTAARAICFENECVVGFLHSFSSARDMLDGWEKAQEIVLNQHMQALRGAGSKAWNVYSVFLTGDREPSLVRRVERIEEDFSLTRKIARCGIQTKPDLTRALYPLLPVFSQPAIHDGGYAARLQARLKDISPQVMNAFLSSMQPTDVARLLMDPQ
jgi:hypothetical protein